VKNLLLGQRCSCHGNPGLDISCIIIMVPKYERKSKIIRTFAITHL